MKKKRASSGGAGLSELRDGGVYGLDDGGDVGDGSSGVGGSGSGGHPGSGGGNQSGGSSGSGGGSSAGGGDAAGGATGDGGDGNGGHGGAIVHGCLDSSPPEGCSSTLVKNGTFTDDANWAAETDVTQVWSASDSTETTGSGSLSVESTLVLDAPGTGLAGSVQCVDVNPDTTYIVGANIFIATGQGPGSAGISTWVYDVPNCAGRSSLTGLSVLAGTVNAWVPTLGAIHTTFDAKSMLVRLVAAKPYRQTTFEVLFDDVRLYPAPN